MSTTIATLAGTTGSGLGSARHVVWAPGGRLWWAFGFTGTTALSSWSSSDNSPPWTAGATHTLGHAHASEGRNLQVVCELSSSNLDIVHVVYEVSTPSGHEVYTLRGTIAGGTLTWHTSETTVGNVAGPGGITAPAYSSGALAFDSGHKVFIANGALQDQDLHIVSSGADAGTAEQMTPVTYSGVVTPDAGMSNEVKSAVLVDLGATKLLLVSDNGTGDATCTALSAFTWDGSAWAGSAGNTTASGSISAIDKNDWGMVAISPSDVHLVIRLSGGGFSHRRYNGTSWSAGNTVPSQASLAGGGIALGTDRMSIWLSVIDTDGANTVRTIRWTSAAYNDVQDTWDGAWTASETSSATRTFIGCGRDVSSAATLLIYWTEGSSLVAVTAPAVSPPDPPGTITRDVISALGTDTGHTTLVGSFASTQPTAGTDKIVAGFWASFSSTPTVSSVKDNCTDVGGGHAFTAVTPSVMANVQAFWLYWLDLPATAVWTGNYTVTVTFSIASGLSDIVLGAYSGAVLGAPFAANNNSGTGTTATSGAASLPTNGFYVAGLVDSSGSAAATETFAGPFLRQQAQLNGSGQQVGAFADAINNLGSQNASVTLESSLNWNSVIAAWLSLPGGGPVSAIRPGPAWRRHFQHGRYQTPLPPAPAPPPSTAPIYALTGQGSN